MYPININLHNKQCLVIGGGQVAGRKINSLLLYGAVITVVSPEAGKEIASLALQGTVIWIQRNFVEEDLRDKFLVFIATDDNNINQYISQLCQQKGILVNAVDDPPNCDFYVPAVVRRGSLTISISTEGKSPLVAKKLRQELEKIITEEYGVLVDILGEQREIIKTRIEDIETRQKIFQELVELDVLELLAAGEEERARERIKECISFWLD